MMASWPRGVTTGSSINHEVARLPVISIQSTNPEAWLQVVHRAIHSTSGVLAISDLHKEMDWREASILSDMLLKCYMAATQHPPLELHRGVDLEKGEALSSSKLSFQKLKVFSPHVDRGLFNVRRCGENCPDNRIAEFQGVHLIVHVQFRRRRRGEIRLHMRNGKFQGVHLIVCNKFGRALPHEFDVLCTHPMFGPESGEGSWAGLPFVYDKVRIRNGRRSRSADKFLDIFASEGCRMVEMTCAEHDRYAAGSQFITHTVGRVLGKLGLERTPINTKGYETLLGLVENTSGDSFELYYGLFMYNPNATEELERLERAFDSIKRQLFGQLHDVLRKQLFGGVDGAAEGSSSSTTNGNSQIGTVANGESEVINNTSTAPPVFEAVLNKTIKLDKDPDSISQSLNNQ